MIAACGSGRLDRVNTRSIPTPAKSSKCRPPTSCCTGLRGRSEAHRYDESLRSIDLVTKRERCLGEPLLPLSVVVHIDYQRGAKRHSADSGDIKPLNYADARSADAQRCLISATWRTKNAMIELLQQRDVIQAEAREVLRRKFLDFDIECVDVLIGKPDTAEAGGKIETLLEQLRLRQLSIEQIETFERATSGRGEPADVARVAGKASMQTELLTNSHMQVRINQKMRRGRFGPRFVSKRGRTVGRHGSSRAQHAACSPRRRCDSVSHFASGFVGSGGVALLQDLRPSAGSAFVCVVDRVAEQMSCHCCSTLGPRRVFHGRAPTGEGAERTRACWACSSTSWSREKSGFQVGQWRWCFRLEGIRRDLMIRGDTPWRPYSRWRP